MEKRQYKHHYSYRELVEIKKMIDMMDVGTPYKKMEHDILVEYFINEKSAKTIAKEEKFYSNQRKPMSHRMICLIIKKYVPDYYTRRRKTKRKNQDIRQEQTKLKIAMLKTHDGICGKCHVLVGRENLELDHMIPVDFGGGNDEANLIFLCKDCHRKKTNYQRKIVKSKIKGETQ